MAPTTRKFAGLTTRLASDRAPGQPAVGDIDGGVDDPRPERRDIERLQLYEQFVHYAGDALPAGPGPQATPGGANCVNFLDKTDRPALTPGVRSQGAEIRTDLAVGLPVVHRLESRRRDEKEGHPGFGRHSLGNIGLARPGRAFEEHGPAGGAAHSFLESAVGQEEVERLHDLFHHHLGAHYVGQSYAHLFRPVQHVR